MARASHGSGRVAFDDPERGRHGGRDEQEEDEDVVKLREEAAPRRHRLVAGEAVLAVSGEARTGVVAAQPLARVGAEGGGDLVDVPAIGVGHVGRLDCIGGHAPNPSRGRNGEAG